MNRNADYKMRSLRCVSSKDGRTKRLEELKDNRRMARQAKCNSKRGLTEINQNITNVNEISSQKKIVAPVESSHESKLRDRLEKLKLWREKKVASELKAKSQKKVPFLVPGVLRRDKNLKDDNNPSSTIKPVSSRVTRSQTKNAVTSSNKWSITSTKPVMAVTATKEKKKEVPSFAPDNFVFKAPKGK